MHIEVKSEGGRGFPLILIQEWFTDSSYCWSEQLHQFKKSYRVFLFPIEGHPGSEKLNLKSGESLMDRNEVRLVRLVQDLKKPVRIVAHGVSAIFALRVTAAIPDSVRSLVLISPRIDDAGIKLSTLMRRFPSVSFPLFLMMQDPTGSGLKIGRRLQLRKIASAAIASLYLKDLNESDLAGLFPDIKSRVCIIAGARDNPAITQTAERLNNELQNSLLFRYSNLGHNPHIEDPDLINHVIHDFIKKSDPLIPRGIQSIKDMLKNLLGN